MKNFENIGSYHNKKTTSGNIVSCSPIPTLILLVVGNNTIIVWKNVSTAFNDEG